MLTKYEEYLNAMQKVYNIGVGARDLLQGQLTEKEVELAKARDDIAIWEQVQVLFAKVSEFAREQLKTRIEETVTAALLAVFGEGLTFRINMRTSNGQPAADWQVVSQCGDLEVAASPEDARGGGITDIVSLALRLAMLELVKPKPGGPVILDEPGKMISAEYAGSLAYFLKQYAASTGRQVLLVTHNATLVEMADRSYLVTQNNGVSEVKLL